MATEGLRDLDIRKAKGNVIGDGNL